MRTHRYVDLSERRGPREYVLPAPTPESTTGIAWPGERLQRCAAGWEPHTNLVLGVPVKLGRKGIEKIIEVSLTPDEKAALAKSADAVREPMGVVKL